MRIVFCGTPDFAVPSLRALVAGGHEVALVLTQPDRPAGRKLEVHVPAVKRVALEFNLPLLQPDKLKTNATLREALTAILPDAIVVVAYGRIIPDWMLKLPRFGNINVHGSLLPKYRGAAPIQWAVASGETETGVTTMRLDAGLDTGDTLLSRSISIGPSTTAAELYPQLAELGAEVLLDTLSGLQAGALHAKPQDHAAATLAPILTREDGRLEPASHTAAEAYNRWRGFSPWPGCWAMFRQKRFLVHRLHPVSSAVVLNAGELAVQQEDLLLGVAGGTVLCLDEVQLEGKSRLPGLQFARSFQLRPGEGLG